MNSVLAICGLATFASTLFIRLTDPIVPQIAMDLSVAPHSVALLSTAFAVPWAIVQPVLGPAGDIFGKQRVMLVGMVMLVITAVIGAFAVNYWMLLGSRVVAGAAAAGVFPIAMALVGDTVPMERRQLAIGRVLMTSLLGMLLGASAAGILADWIGWRGVFLAAGCVGLAACVTMVFGLRSVPNARTTPARWDSIIANYATILRNPRSKVCYGAVFIEGIAVFGIMPFVALLLASSGEPRASIAGLVVAGFAVGGLIFTSLVGIVLPRFTQRQLMTGGGLFIAVGLLAMGWTPPWQGQLAAMGVMGFGFYMLHSCIQLQMTELAPRSRGTAAAMHSFSFFSGQALGPILYGFGIVSAGTLATCALGAMLVIGVGLITARLLGSPANPAESMR